MLPEKDLSSIDNLANIKRNQVVDIYENGTISIPYDKGVQASTWRTSRWMTGISQNRDDIPVIKKLIERIFYSYARGDEFLETKLQKSIEGLNNLKISYQEVNRLNTVQDIEKIVTYIESNLTKFKESTFNFNFRIKNDQFNELAQLEASCLNVAGMEDKLEGVDYYIDKINMFLLTENVKKDEKQVLEGVKAALIKSTQFPLTKNKAFFQQVIDESQGLVAKDATDEEKDAALTEAENRIYQRHAETQLAELDAMPPEEQAHNGIFISMAFRWQESGDEKGHAFCLALCKEADGSYTASQINAGGLSIGELVKFNFHLNYKQPLSVSIPPVIEFGPLNRDEAKNFLVKALKNSEHNAPDKKTAEKDYRALVEDFFNRRRPNKIPARRIQVAGNCGIRSVKEEIIFSLQKWGQSDLANRLMKFTDSRMSGTSLPFEDVLPLKQMSS